MSIIEVVRPYPLNALETLPEEENVILDNHAFWCATKRIARILSEISHLDDRVFVCRALNDSYVGELLKTTSRGNKLSIFNLEELISRLRSQQILIRQNSTLRALMDSPDEISQKIKVATDKIIELRTK